jgi:membrane associated rhomboid family serine protease
LFPLRDENPTKRVTWMNWLLVAANITVFAYEVYLQVRGGDGAVNAFFGRWAFDPAHLAASPLAPAVLLTVFTAMFVHAGWLHVGGNMLYLWIFGNNIEDRLGPGRYLAFYLVCGVVAAVAQSVASGFADIPSLGASGAIAGVLGAYLLLYPRAKVLTAIWIVIFIELALIPAWAVIGIWFAIQLANGIATVGPAAAGGGVAYFAHVGAVRSWPGADARG